MPRGIITRTLVITAVLVLVFVAYTALATTYQVFQPTNPSINSNNAQGYLAQLPQCSISSNPYGGGTGTTGLFSCVAINYGAVSIAVWFYLPQGGQGVLLSIEDQQYPNEHYEVPLLYVGTNGYLYANDWNGSKITVSTSSALSPGWHMAVFEEWYSSGTYYLALYLDGSLVGQTSSSSGTMLFNINSGNYPMSYSDIGSGYASSSNWLNVNNAWFFFNGSIAYVAVYNTVLSQSQVQQLYQAGFPSTLYSDNLVVAYFLNITYYQGLSSSDYYFTTYFTNTTSLSNMGISNATAITITPSGSVGQVPSSQFFGPFYQFALNFYGAVISGSTVSFQTIGVNATLTCPNYDASTTTVSYTSVSSITTPICYSSLSFTVTALPSGWFNNVWSFAGNSWVVGRTFTLAQGNASSSSAYYVVAGDINDTAVLFMSSALLPSAPMATTPMIKVILYGLPSITAYPYITVNTTVRIQLSSTPIYLCFYTTAGDVETLGVTPNAFANTYLVTNTTTYTVPSTASNSTLYVPVASGSSYFFGQLPLLWNTTQYTVINVTLDLLASVSTYPTVTINSTYRLPLGSSATAYPIYFTVNPGDTETIGITPNGVGVYFSISNETTYVIPTTPHNSSLLIPLGTAFIGGSLSNFWNATTIETYNATMVNGTGGTGPFTIKLGGVNVTASEFSWNITNPPNAITAFTGVDGKTYAFNPAWVQSFGITRILVGGSVYFVPTVIGKTLTSTNITFIAQGVWLNETTVNNSFMTYYPLPSFINFLSTPIFMYVNGTTSTRYLVPALAIINNNLQQYTVQYMNVTAWSNVGSLMGVAKIQTPFSFIGFVSNSSLAPIWILLNGTVGVPPILFNYYPQIRYLYMPDTTTTSYSLLQVAVNVPSQLFNQWSGNLVFGISQAMPNGYYALVSGGFYAPPPTQFNLYVPTYLLNKLSQLFLASYPQSTTCTMLQILSNPLDTTICQGISQVVTVNLGNTQVGKPAFGDVSGAFNIAPLTRNLTLEQIIAINAATAALVILFIKKHQSLPAGLMLGGAIALALGVFLWLEMEIGIGILLFVAGAALATTHRTQ